jgi:hypothetical protein
MVTARSAVQVRRLRGDHERPGRPGLTALTRLWVEGLVHPVAAMRALPATGAASQSCIPQAPICWPEAAVGRWRHRRPADRGESRAD